MRKTYILVGDKFVLKGSQAPDAERHHYVQADIEPYQSMADGSMITSRSKHRDHLRKHNCVEVGNERMETPKPVYKDTRREVLREQVANMTHAQANQIISRLRDDARFHNPHRKG
jgi:hypothetical protein